MLEATADEEFESALGATLPELVLSTDAAKPEDDSDGIIIGGGGGTTVPPPLDDSRCGKGSASGWSTTVVRCGGGNAEECGVGCWLGCCMG